MSRVYRHLNYGEFSQSKKASSSNSADLVMSNPLAFNESTWILGNMISIIFYGVVFVLSILCWHSLWPRMRSHSSGYKKCRFFFCCVTFLFVISTIFAVGVARSTQLAFIIHRSYPGGPSGYHARIKSPPLGIAYLLSDWCTVLLMMWQCVVVYKDTRMHLVVFILSGIMFTASIATGIVWFVIVSSDAWHWLDQKFLIPYVCISLSINIFFSLLTALRLLYHRSRISRVLGVGHGEIYVSFTAIIVESAAIYSISSILALVPLAMHNPLANSFGEILGEVQIVASLLIIFRVIQGKGYKNRARSTEPTLHSSLEIRFPQPASAFVETNRCNVEVTVDQETTHDEPTPFPKPVYSKEHTGEYAKTVNAPVGSAVCQ